MESNDSPESSRDPDSQGIEELANAANSISPLRDEHKELRTRYDDICGRLNVNLATSSRGWELLSRIPTPENTHENERFWIACSIYIAGSTRFSILRSNTPEPNGVSLSQLLRECNIRLVDFFEPLKSFIALLQLGKAYEEQLKQVEKNFVIMCILFQKYDKMFDSLFHSAVDTPNTPAHKDGLENRVRGFGWSLFLFCKGRLMENPDLVQAFHLLICCLNLLLVHAPPHMRKISFRDSQFVNIVGQSHEPEEQSNTLAPSTLRYLCKINNAMHEDVAVFNERIFVPFIETLCKHKILKYQPGKLQPDSPSTNSLYLSGLLDSYLQRNLQSVDKQYESKLYTSGDIDERLFQDHSDQIGTPSRLSSRTYYNYKPTNNVEWEKASTFASPLSKTAATPPHAAQTPINSAMSTMMWLKTTLSDREDVPSTALRRFFRACPVDVTTAIEQRVKDLLAKLVLPTLGPSTSEVHAGSIKARKEKDEEYNSRDANDNSLHEPSGDSDSQIEHDSINLEASNEESHKGMVEDLNQKKGYIAKMYYKLLESMLLAEEARLHTDNFATLLNHELFQRSLLVCAAEVVLYVYKATSFSFPAVLRMFDVTPFDLCKLIENVVRLEQGLPRILVRHLSKIEEMILESLAWESGSPVYALLHAQQTQVTGTPKKHTMIPPSQAFASPARNPKQTPASSTSQKNAAGSLSLDLFLRKVFLLLSIRSQNLCGNLQLPSAVYQQVYKVLIHILTVEVSLICNRHVDQLLMSTLYGVSRVNGLNVTFKSIIEKYSVQPQSSARIYRDVLLNDGKKGDIITFYNNIYIPVMQQYLIHAQTSQVDLTNPSPASVLSSPQLKKGLSHTFSSSLQIPHSPHHNLYVSPMSTHTTPRTTSSAFSSTSSFAQMSSSTLLSNTPRSVLFSFGQSPAQDLRNINNSINSPMPAHTQLPTSPLSQPFVMSPPPHGRARTKRQLFDSEEDNSQDGAPKKRPAVDEE